MTSKYQKLIRILGASVAGLAFVSLCYRFFDIADATLGWVFPFWDYSFWIMISFGVIGLILGLVSLARWHGTSWKVDAGIQFFLRLWIAFNLINAGVSKLMDTQFNLPEYVKDTPIIDLHPFHLTWYYFGYSQGFQTVIGLSQIIGSLLLLSRRTRLLGAIVLFPVVLNILLVNIFFDINPNALIEISLLSLAVLYVLLLDWARLKELILAVPGKTQQIFKYQNLLRTGAIGLVIAGGVFLRFLTNDGDDNQTFLKGVWQVDDLTVTNDSIFYVSSLDTHLSKLYFEYYTDQQVIMEFGDPKLRRFIPSRLDSAEQTLTFQIDGQLMILSYVLSDPDQIILNGTYLQDTVGFQIRKIRESTK